MHVDDTDMRWPKARQGEQSKTAAAAPLAADEPRQDKSYVDALDSDSMAPSWHQDESMEVVEVEKPLDLLEADSQNRTGESLIWQINRAYLWCHFGLAIDRLGSGLLGSEGEQRRRQDSHYGEHQRGFRNQQGR